MLAKITSKNQLTQPMSSASGVHSATTACRAGRRAFYNRRFAFRSQ